MTTGEAAAGQGHMLFDRAEFEAAIGDLHVSSGGTSQMFNCLVRFAVQEATTENGGKVTAQDIAYQLPGNKGLIGWLVSVPNIQHRLNDWQATEEPLPYIGSGTIAACVHLVEGCAAAPDS